MADRDGTAAAKSFGAFVDLIARLRGPGGCPWDREQTHDSLKAMTIEEAYEVLEAIDRADDEHLAGELGDLLLQVVFHAQIAAEAGRFTVQDVIERVAAKMVRRHPHVFAGAKAETPNDVLRSWEAIKQAERAAKGGAAADASMLDSVGTGLPAVMEAFQMTTKVSRVGFDWASVPAVLEKLEEELGELREAAGSGTDTGSGAASQDRRVAEEVGDLLFAAVNVARLMGADPESALKSANRKFRRRFGFIEQALARRGRTPSDATLEEMEELWAEAKAQEGKPGT